MEQILAKLEEIQQQQGIARDLLKNENEQQEMKQDINNQLEYLFHKTNETWCKLR